MEQEMNAYAELKLRIEELEEQRKRMSREILRHMHEENIRSAETDLGKITLKKSVRYIYSPQVKELEEDVKILKHREQEEGVAEKQETESLQFTKAKI